MEDFETIEKLRVSVATYNQIFFPHPENGIVMLALERKATVLRNGTISVLAQPFGGGVRILDAMFLQKIIGEIQFDSERSKQEGDFRILIPPSKWEAVKRYCLHHLESPDDSELEATPDRELIEEFEETIQLDLTPNQYKVEPLGFVVEDNPVRTKNWYARGYLTVRVYRTFKVRLLDNEVCTSMLAVSQTWTDYDLGKIALEDAHQEGRGRANSVLVLPLKSVTDAYLALPHEKRYGKIVVENHRLDESVLVVLGNVDVPQYQRI